MALNLELKIKVFNHNNIIQLIEQYGGKKIKLLYQKDSYFVFNKGLLKLREQNGVFELIKYKRDEINKERWSDYSLLYLNGQNVEKYLYDIFNLECIVKKERTLIIYKNTRIHLDKVEGLGNFLELETVVEKITREEAKEEFEEVVNILHLDLSNEIRKSYRDLILEKSGNID